MTEQCAFDQAIRNRSAIDGDKRLLAASAHGVDGFGDQLLTHACLALNQHCSRSWRNHFDGLQDFLHGRRFGDNRRGGLFLRGFLALFVPELLHTRFNPRV